MWALTFAGAFPTTLLYCLMPPLAALALRRRAASDPTAPQPPALLPGGDATLYLLVALALGLLGTSGGLALLSLPFFR